MKGLSNDTGVSISPFQTAALLLFVALNLAVYLIRLLNVWHYGALFCPTGGESLMIYSIWKGMHHLAVYQWPFSFPFSLSLYNYLFYATYAGALRLMGASDASIPVWGRLLTSAFAVVGALAQWKLVQKHLNLRGARSALSLLFALGLWFGTSMIQWWALAVRPDLAAAALVMIALWAIVRLPRFGFAIAGIFFYLAWSFKESVILTLVGVCLFLLFQRRWRDLSALAAVFAVLTAITLLLGTPEYRFSILAAPRLVSEFSSRQALRASALYARMNLYWLAAPIVLLCARRARQADRTVLLLVTVFAVALAGGIAAMAKVGAADNYLFEAFVAGSTLLQIAVFAMPGRVVTALVLFGCAQPTIQLTPIARWLHLKHIQGNIRIANAADYADAMALRARLAPLKKPLFTTEEGFSAPWISTGDQAPALVIDPIFHDATRQRCENGGIERMLQQGEIPSVMLAPDDRLYRDSLNPGYRKIGDSTLQGVPYNIYVFGAAPQNTGPALH